MPAARSADRTRDLTDEAEQSGAEKFALVGRRGPYPASGDLKCDLIVCEVLPQGSLSRELHEEARYLGLETR